MIKRKRLEILYCIIYPCMYTNVKLPYTIGNSDKYGIH